MTVALIMMAVVASGWWIPIGPIECVTLIADGKVTIVLLMV